MNSMVKAPVWMYCAAMGFMLIFGGWLGNEMTNKEWVKKIKAYSEVFPDKTMGEFMEECSKEE